jgi:endonuclease G, mitochondrial
MRMNQITAALGLTLSLMLSVSWPSSALPTGIALAQVPLDSTDPALNQASTNAVSGNIHLLLGNPSNAAATDAENYLLAKPQSWQLNQSWIGSTSRQNDFRPDTSLPSSFYQVTPGDYTGSGYDRGHQTPSGDRTNSVVNNSATFLMTNIIPQTPDLNQGPWEKLESYSRQLVGQGKELYIVAGVEQQKGFLSGGKVTVPARNWKVIVVLNSPGLGLSGITANTRVIAVDMPNDNGIRAKSWTAYRTTVDQIEAATGYDLLSNVPVEIQSVIESR